MHQQYGGNMGKQNNLIYSDVGSNRLWLAGTFAYTHTAPAGDSPKMYTCGISACVKVALSSFFSLS